MVKNFDATHNKKPRCEFDISIPKWYNYKTSLIMRLSDNAYKTTINLAIPLT